MSTFVTDIHISIRCVDDVHGYPGVVIYDRETFPMSSKQAAQPQGNTFNDGHSPESPREKVDDRGLKVNITIQRRKRGLSGSQSPAPGPGCLGVNVSNVAPPNACDEEEPMEID